YRRLATRRGKSEPSSPSPAPSWSPSTTCSKMEPSTRISALSISIASTARLSFAAASAAWRGSATRSPLPGSGCKAEFSEEFSEEVLMPRSTRDDENRREHRGTLHRSGAQTRPLAYLQRKRSRTEPVTRNFGHEYFDRVDHEAAVRRGVRRTQR